MKLEKALTCKKETSLIEACRILKKENQRRIFIIDDSEKILGILTTVDVTYKGIENPNAQVQEIMSSPVETIAQEDPLEKAITIMDKHGSLICPVVDKNQKLVGTIKYSDVVNFLLDKQE
jgi:L-aspartate semialdehyde sulfurtransferase